MHVQAALARQPENRGRQQETVGDDDHDVRRECSERVARCIVFQRGRLQDRKIELERALLDRARGDPLAATAAAIRLRADGDETMTRCGDRIERGHCEVGGSGEDDRQGPVHGGRTVQIAGARDGSRARPSARNFRSFSIFLRTRWRFISDR